MAERSQTDSAAGRDWWSWKIPIGAALMCVAVIGAQFLTRDFSDVGVWAMWMVGSGVPVIAVIAVTLLTAPPARGQRRRRRSIFAIIVAVAAIAELLLLFLSAHVRDRAMDNLAQAMIVLLSVLAGAGTYLHLARTLRGARYPVASAAFLILALLVLLNATLYMTRYGVRMGLANAAWTYGVPGAGERVTPFAFVQDFMIRPRIEMQQNIEEPIRGAYVLVTVVTPIGCFALMIWLMAQAEGFLAHRRPPQS